MTWNEYCDLKYYIQKEYNFYLRIFNKTEEDKKEFEYYKKLDNNLYEFEKATITELIKNLSREDFKKILDK